MQIGSIASAGMYQALRRFDASVQRVARVGAIEGAENVLPVEPVDPVHEIVNQIGAKQQFSANLAVLDTANAMTKRLLDIRV